MSLLTWRGRSQLIDWVVVPASALEDDAEPSTLPIHVSMFIHDALSGFYVREELPREALIAHHLSVYVGEVNNGGHAQFVGNTGWDDGVRADVREGLATLGLEEAARIFADLEAFSEDHPKRFARNHGEARDMDPYFDELDRRFYHLGEDAIEAANTEWIKTLPWLRIMPDVDYGLFPGWKVPRHPLREARLAARRRKNEPAMIRFLLALRERLSQRD